MTALSFPSVFRSTPVLLALLFLATTAAFQPLVRPAHHLHVRNMMSPDTVDLATTTTEWVSSSATGAMVSQLESFWQTCPYQAAALVCGVKASAADWVAQSQSMVDDSVVEEPATNSVLVEEPAVPTTSNNIMWDRKRNAAFVLYGALYQGMAHEFIFNHLYPEWFGTGVEPTVVLMKVVFNLLVQTTLVTLPFAYLCQAAICGSPDESPDNNSHGNPTEQETLENNNNNNNNSNAVDVALAKYWEDIQTQGLLWKCFALWGPVQCLTFSVVPEHLRVTFMALVSFFWLILLSHISSSSSSTSSSSSSTEHLTTTD